MARKKIQMKRIDNTTTQQVTFSKRRKCIFKKALELSTFCEAEIELIVFRSTRKLFDYASPRCIFLLFCCSEQKQANHCNLNEFFRIN
ncbi:hypothetical protein I3842_05G046300 [Carya illinoinensis]|uniref:MADS-box domain-containing protein n=1 Tax=Carya illinoinensis TaxID=32201 RepID=A0A922EW00_CARIL|nr:hypothetical protein I3842_05G046300 [Carya illinoinensis]